LTKVIAPGILLHKKILEKNANKDIEVYSYRVELIKLDTIDFIADFTGLYKIHSKDLSERRLKGRMV
jgi:hypothetical protein